MPAKNDMKTELALLLVLAVLWGASYSFIKIGVATIPPVTLIAARTLIAGSILLAIIRWRGLALPVDAASWRRFAFQACLNSVVPFTLIAAAERSVDASLATILNATSPIFTFLLTALITRHEPVTMRKLFGVGAGIAGICLIIGTQALGGLGHQLWAQLAIVAATICYAGAAIFGRSFKGLDPMLPAAGSMLCGAVMLVPLSLVFDRPWTLAPSTASVLALLGLSVFSTAMAFCIYFRLIHTLGSVGTTSQAYLRVPIGVGIGSLFLGESLGPTAMVGNGLCRRRRGGNDHSRQQAGAGAVGCACDLSCLCLSRRRCVRQGVGNAVIFDAARAAASRLFSPELRSVFLKTLGLTLLALVALWFGLTSLVEWLGLPWLETLIPGLPSWAGWLGGIIAAIALAFGMALLIAPVTAIVAGLFLDDVAEVVERTDYPNDPPGRPMPALRSLVLAVRFFGVVILGNIVALLLLLVPGINIAAFFIVNGYLLGREFFEFAAMRFRPEADARALRRKYAGTVFLAGLVIDAFLAVPLLNLLTPLFAAAMMVHLHKAVSARDAARISRR